MLAPIDVGVAHFSKAVPTDRGVPSERPLKHVLNGFVFALFGLLVPRDTISYLFKEQKR